VLDFVLEDLADHFIVGNSPVASYHVDVKVMFDLCDGGT
jgi:hypothetical protein